MCLDGCGSSARKIIRPSCLISSPYNLTPDSLDACISFVVAMVRDPIISIYPVIGQYIVKVVSLAKINSRFETSFTALQLMMVVFHVLKSRIYKALLKCSNFYHALVYLHCSSDAQHQELIHPSKKSGSD